MIVLALVAALVVLVVLRSIDASPAPVPSRIDRLLQGTGYARLEK